MSQLGPYIQQLCEYTPVHPSPLPKGQIFGSQHSTPRLVKDRTNRILLYPGSFNPPHRGHLQLLKHTFLHGADDLNIIAAILLPRSDESVLRKITSAGGTFMLGRDERCLLWKNDLGFPEWALVYENHTDKFTEFSEKLKEKAKEDGYTIEFVMLYGPEMGSPDAPPTGAYGCEMVIMSDAGRKASWQRSSGRMRDFEGCTKWKQVNVNEKKLIRYARAKAIRAMLSGNALLPRKVVSMMMDGPAYIENDTQERVEQSIEDLGRVLYCRLKTKEPEIVLRFVKCRRHEWITANHISSTEVREVMRSQCGNKLKEALEEMALSADILWTHRSSWAEHARLGEATCIKFPTPNNEALEKEDSPSETKGMALVATKWINDRPTFELENIHRAKIRRNSATRYVDALSACNNALPSRVTKRRNSAAL